MGCVVDQLSAQHLLAQAVILGVGVLTGVVLRGMLSPTAGLLAFSFFGACVVCSRVEAYALEGVRAAFLGCAVLSVVFCRVLAVQTAKAAEGPPKAGQGDGARRYVRPVRCVSQTLVLAATLLGLMTFGARAECVGAGHLDACVFRAAARGGVKCERASSVNAWERMWNAKGEAPRVYPAAKHGESSFHVSSLGFEVAGKVQGVSLRRAIKAYATEHALKGWVRNTKAKGTVVGRIQGTDAHLAVFRKWLDQPGGPATAQAPAPGAAASVRDGGAHIDKVTYNEDVLAYTYEDFHVLSDAESAKYEH